MISQDQSRVDVLARPQAPVAVGELTLEIYRARLRVDTVIDEGQLTGLDPLLLGQRDLHRELALRHELAHRGQLLLGNREIHINRMHLVDDDHRSVGVGLDQVAGMHQQVAGAAVDWRANLTVLEIQLRGLHRGGVGLHRGRECRGVRLDLIVLLARSDVLFEQHRVAMLVGRGHAILRAILGEIRLRLLQRGFERPRIDREQQIALLDVLSL